MVTRHPITRYVGGIIIGVLITAGTWAQSNKVTGVITAEEDGGALPGVNILEKGTSNGTISNMNGDYSITVQQGAVLVFSFVGYKNKEVVVGGRATVDVVLEADVVSLNEIVVVGYGQQEKRDVTGAMASLSAKDFNAGVIASPDQLFQGKMSGVQITSSSGEPGAGVNITIRGASSIRSNNNPLIVVDGFPLDGSSSSASGEQGNASTGATGEATVNDADLGSSSSKNPLNFINPADIESIDVLKDASATAIYGSRGANGVILITTKKGARGQGSVSYNFFTGVSKISKKLDLVKAQDYVALAANAGANASSVDFGGVTDWQDKIYRTAPTMGHSLSFGGGSENSLYRASLSYLNQRGIVHNSGLTRYTARINGSHKFANDKLGLDFQLTASKTDNDNAPISTNAGYQGSLIGAALQANPTIPVKRDDGTYVQRNQTVDGVVVSSDFRNPVAMLDYITDKEENTRLLGNMALTWEIIDGLKGRVNVGVDNGESVRRVFYDRRLKLSDSFDDDGGRVTIYNRYQSSYLFEGFLTYTTTLKSNDLIILGGYSYQEFLNQGHYFGVENLPSGDQYLGFNNVDGGSSPSPDESPFGSDKVINALQSYFGRVNYNVQDKYLFTATLRADGSSKFGDNNKYGLFPSLAFGWRITEEPFAPKVFDDLKLRAGFGITGNQEIPSGISKARYQINNTTGALTLLSTPNPDIKWEQSTQWNIGVDFSILGGRLSGTLDYFNKNTTDLVIQINTPQPAPTQYAWDNLDANVINTGLECSLTGYIIQGTHFQWNASGNITYFITNKIDNLDTYFNTGSINGQGLTGAYAQRISEGQPLYAFYMQKFLGITDAGTQAFADEGTLRFVGSPHPNVVYGLTNNFQYKFLDLSFTFNGKVGNDIYNNTANALFLKGALGNGRNVTYKVARNSENPTEAPIVSTRYLEKGSFLRLNNVTIGYALPVESVTWLNTARVYVSAQNLFVIDNYSGYDPEVNVDKNMNGIPSLGIDYTGFPRSRTITAGLSVRF